jgi:hypothetical protein
MTMTETPTLQQRMKAMLEKSGIPFKKIDCYGSQIVITAWSEDAARKWAVLLGQFATFRGITHGMDKTQDDSAIRKANPGLVKANFFHDVWHVFASI